MFMASSFRSTCSSQREEPPVELANAGCGRPLLLICDHASNTIPPALEGLGLPPGELARHIAWDIGAAQLTRLLAFRLGACAVLSKVSRLVIDCNRPLGHPSSICSESDGTGVPGNRQLSEAAAAARADAYFRPYHNAVSRELERLERRGKCTVVVAIHSFTPVMRGCRRPWEVGILWNADGRLAEPLMTRLRAAGGLTVGDNEPYSGRFLNYSTDRHGGAHGRPHVSVEVRQDQLADEGGIRRWAALLADCLVPVLAAV
jgi:predicted N-formylglutamate amidohydrolase